ncbi:GcrA family cell cycle regulator [Paracoccus benzoatiresistens]|uniref:GcrA cell cycle regulator n=1 Tax=Paracoccus benzoatiresistens TaxID=2997341 RepID=A0ABT4JBE8_9RHOB|nr:GcrA family cell cycle regulator [Paracoccus sp. EF6]MCZ0964010.1 GcrA cell cycle regulator [Paracoccus sp. EF6]
MSWTDERVETLKRMWAEGQSASAIAKELGGVTRNAVIGKVHRLGLSNRNDEPEPAPAPAPEPAIGSGAEKKIDRKPAPAAQAPRPEPQPEIAAAPTPPAEEEPVTQPVFTPVPRRPIVPAGQPLPPQPSANEISPETLASVREVEKRARKLTLMELTERTCKWPIGDPATEKFWFCGLPSQPGKPYCEAHVSVAFQPMSSRRDRRR